MRLAFIIAALLAAPLSSTAQVRDTPRPSAPAQTDAKLIGSGWTALAAGQLDAAARAADTILQRRPWDHAAMALRIEALSSREPMQGLEAYEKWLGARTAEDPGLLEPVARAVVTHAARQADPDLRREAIRLLRDARVPLPAQPSASGVTDSLVTDAERAASGDAAALKRLETAATDPARRSKTPVVHALEAAGPAGVPVLITMVTSPSHGPSRGEAAAALGRLRAEQARPVLQQMLDDQDPFVRSSAAVALARLGDSLGQTYVDRMLHSDIPDVQLMAADAWDGKPGPWVDIVRPLLENRDGLVRLHAARVIAPIDPEAARRVLQDAAGDPNPAIRAEAGAIAGQLPPADTMPTDIAALRRLLRDTDTMVRLRAAGALLGAARGH